MTLFDAGSKREGCSGFEAIPDSTTAPCQPYGTGLIHRLCITEHLFDSLALAVIGRYG